MNNLLKKYACYFNRQKGRIYPCSNQIVTCVYITEDKQEVIDKYYIQKISILKLEK